MEAQPDGIRRTKFTIAMTVVFFVLFAGAYWFLSERTIEPHYYLGLIFAIPFVSFAVVTYLLMKGSAILSCLKKPRRAIRTAGAAKTGKRFCVYTAENISRILRLFGL